MKVNLLIIGAQKAGTTSLYNYIKQHSEIYAPEVKEIHYFVYDRVYEKGESYYHSYFRGYDKEQIVASAYVHMLPSKLAPARVYDYNPDMKFLVMLRDPVERAYSAYNFAIKNGWEDEKVSFEETLKLEPERIKQAQYDLTYFYNGLYYKHLKNWLQYFPQDRFLLIKDTALKENPRGVLKKIAAFLDLPDESHRIDVSKAYNKAGKVRLKFLQRLLLNKDSKGKELLGSLLPQQSKVWIRSKIIRKVISLNKIEKKYEPLDKRRKKRLYKYFEKDQRSLEKEFGISFTTD